VQRSAAEPRISRTRAFALAGLVLVVVAALDQATKAVALASLAPGDRASVFFAIDLSITRNRGIAFGALAGAGDTVIVALVAASLAVLVAYFAARATRPLLWLPVGVVLGGAAGNLIDRARSGAVTDFIDPTFWPAFNLADVAIVVGVLGLLYVAEGGDEERAESEDGASGDPVRPGGEATPWRDSS
jgi:signal peptidase II